MDNIAPARTHVIAALVASTAALVTRAWLQIELREAGFEPLLAADLSYLVVPPVLLLLLMPALRKDRQFLWALFGRAQVTVQMLLAALAIGLLFRIAWWSQLVARISFGLQGDSHPAALAGPVVHYQCPAHAVVLLGIVVAAVLVPVIEEIIHRGYVQTVLHKRGPLIAVAISTITFAVFHRYSGLPFALAGGMVLGTLYWLSGSLWPPVITHAAINLTPQFTWRCMSLHWNPDADSLPLLSSGLPATILFALSAGTLLWLLLTKCRYRTP